MAILEVKNLRKKFGKTEVLKGIDFTLEKGEVLSIIGSSGSGKTTLLRCLNFLETAEVGTISVNGEKIFDGEENKRYKEAEIRKNRLHFGLVFQNFNLFPHFTVLKNVTDAPISVQKRDKAQVYKEARELLEQMSIGDKENFYPGQLSGGQQQRVAIARALALKPQMLFFDEPTSALDPELTQDILKVIRQLAAQKMTMVIVTHEIEFARNVSDRVIFMENGYIVEEGDPKDVIDNPKNDRVKAFLQKIKN